MEDELADNKVTRRQLLKSGMALTLTTSASAAFAETKKMPLTPSCGGDPELTQAQTPGPYFTPDTPAKNDFRGDGVGGKEMSLRGLVLDQQCHPVASAHVELWHAGPDGRYDNQGFRFRGHLFTDQNGRYDFITLMPGLYPGRTRHFHVKIRPLNGPWLTSQLYFPDEKSNRSDFIFDKRLIMTMQSGAAGLQARFDFVVKT